MIIKRIVLFIAAISLFSCEYDYDAGFDNDFSPQVVVNSILTPDSTIKASLFWTQSISDENEYKVVENSYVALYEDNQIIFEGDCTGGKLVTDIKPREGAQYRIEIDVPQYGRVNAQTSIPLSPTVDIEYTQSGGNLDIYYNSYRFFNIASIDLAQQTRSIMIRALGLYEKGEPEISSNLYATNLFCDQFNTVFDNYHALDKGSNINYEYYIRIPYQNVDLAMPLSFSVSNFGSRWSDTIIGYDDWGYPVYDPQEDKVTHIMIETIAPSDEYDMYYKSAYQQIQLAGGVQIFNQIYPIHSNIENGVGIFAGYSSSTFKLKIENNED